MGDRRLTSSADRQVAAAVVPGAAERGSPVAHHDATGFALRTDQFLAAAATASETAFEPTGRPRRAVEGHAVDGRTALWWTFALLRQGQSAAASRLLRHVHNQPFDDHVFNIFATNIAVLILVAHGDQLEADVHAKLTSWTADGLRLDGGNRSPDYQFHGFNDNMPAKATMGLILGGERLGDARAADHGLWNLERLAGMLRRRGINSEYNSPTYTPLTLHALGAIAHYALNAEARELARRCEQRLWLDLAARFHPGLGALGGPWSRAYTVDMAGGLSCTAMLLWFLLGDQVRPSPMCLFEPRPEVLLHHSGDRAFNIAQACWLAAGHYHPDERAVGLFLAKNYPFRTVATAEQGPVPGLLPARSVRIETVLHEHLAVGTATTPFCGGEQTASYHAMWNETGLAPGTLHGKFVVDDLMPATGTAANRASRLVEPDLLPHRAITFVVQADTTVLALSSPHRTLAAEDGKASGIRSLRELLIFGAHHRRHDGLWVDGKARHAWRGDIPPGAWITVRRGHFAASIRMLGYTVGPEARAPAISAPLRLCENGSYQWLEAVFHEGDARRFSADELERICGGFIVEHAWLEAAEDELALRFAARCAASCLEDYCWFERRVHFRSGNEAETDIEIHWTPGAAAAGHVTIDGNLPADHSWRAESAGCIIEAPPPPPVQSRFFMPWPHFDTPWLHLPGAIHVAGRQG